MRQRGYAKYTAYYIDNAGLACKSGVFLVKNHGMPIDFFEIKDSIETLDLSNNDLVAFPKWVKQLRGLKVLKLSWNCLMSLPEDIGELVYLNVLKLDNNLLRALPEAIGKLANLSLLVVGSNHLKTLPDSIGKLAKLVEFNATSNWLENIPNSFRNISSLEYLYLHDNPLLKLPPEILGPSRSLVEVSRLMPAKARGIIEYFFSSRDSRPLNEAKMIIVGRGGVGKTSLVNRLVRDVFDADERKTDGIAIVPWSISHSASVDAVRLNVWDFGGQEIMHSTHQFFMTKRSVYLLVLNAREGEQDANVEYWLRLIESFGGSSPIIVVINKIKDHAFDLNRRGLKSKYQTITQFVQTDCEDGYGLSELKAAISIELSKLEHLQDIFPANWFAVKNYLADAALNFISYEQYQELCIKNHIIDQTSQSTLVSFLHDLGTVVNFRDHPRLRETHVLNPHWVTNGIYQLLNSRVLAAKKTGEVRIDELVEILPPELYPLDKHQFLMDLMEKFELCYESYDEGGLYLIPELLTKEEPLLHEYSLDALLFEYHYNMLPEGLLPRFIVRARALNKNLPRWRTGVVLEFEENHAIIKADIQDRRISISVHGDQTGRRRLLAVIRSDIERIHSSIKKIQANEMVPLPSHPGTVIPYSKLRKLEAAGRKTITEVVGDDVIDIDIRELLNGIDQGGKGLILNQRQFGARSHRLIHLAFSYSHKDEELRDQLETHLKLLQRNGSISTWHDRKIVPGQQWEDVIDENLSRADIVILLVSSDFIASEYCFEIEMRKAIQRHDRGEAVVLPIIVRPCAWKNTPFAKIQALPKNGIAITQWGNRDEAWKNVTEGIEKTTENLRAILR